MLLLFEGQVMINNIRKSLHSQKLVLCCVECGIYRYTEVVCAYVMGDHAQRPYCALAAQDWHTFSPCLSPSVVHDRGEALLICHKQSNTDSQMKGQRRYRKTRRKNNKEM